MKNIDLLINAWKLVTELYPDWSLDIWGNGPLKAKLQVEIDKLNLVGKVELCGVTNNLSEIYPESSLFVLPSRYEGFPLVLVEAMSYGLPCIGFNISGNLAVIEDGHNGIIVKDRTAQKLAESICKLISSPSLLKKYSDEALSSIEKFNKEKVMNMWMDLFNKIKTR